MPSLSTPQRGRYQSEGFVCPIEVLAADEVDDLRVRYEGLRADENRDGTMLIHMKPHLLYPWLDRLVRDERILDVVADVIGPDILLYSDFFVTKEARTGGVFAFHQDSWGFRLDPMEMVIAWLAFTDSNPANGCVQMLPGSHLDGGLAHAQLKHGDNVLSYGQTVTGVDVSRACDVVLRPGEMSVHHVDMVHASGPNATDDRRAGYLMRYIAPHVRSVGGPKNSVGLMRGQDYHRHWVHEPDVALHPDRSAAAHESIIRDHAASSYVYL